MKEACMRSRQIFMIPALLLCALLVAAVGLDAAGPTSAERATYHMSLPIVLRSYQPPEPCLPHYSEPREILRLNVAGDLYGMRSADLNGDGWPDVVLYRGFTGTTRSAPLGILLNDGRGNLTEGASQVFLGAVPSVVVARELVFADFNGDGRVDIFVADHGMDAYPEPSNQNTLVLSAPGGKLVDATAKLPQQIDYTHSAAAADIDGDGDIDLYVGNGWSSTTTFPPAIWLNSDGAGTFIAATGRLPYPVEDLGFGAFTTCEFVDVDNDGSPDLVLGDAGDDLEGGPDSLVLLNDGTGHFSHLMNAIPSKPFAETDTALDIDAHDLNGDGYQDLLMVFTRWTYVGRYIQVLINNRDGTFRDETAVRLPQSDNYDPWIIWVFLYDLDMDGHLDIVAQPMGAQEALFYLNNGDGSFRPLPNVFNIGTDNLFTFLDVDRDGLLDALWAYGNNGVEGVPEVHFLVQASGCPAF
jgi:hypothetical protein